MTTRDELEQKIIALFTKADECEKLCFIAILYSDPGKERYERSAGYTNGELKQAIKRLRIVQKDCPDDAKSFERAISLIRNNWLHKAAQSSIKQGSGLSVAPFCFRKPSDCIPGKSTKF